LIEIDSETPQRFEMPDRYVLTSRKKSPRIDSSSSHNFGTAAGASASTRTVQIGGFRRPKSSRSFVSKVWANEPCRSDRRSGSPQSIFHSTSNATSVDSSTICCARCWSAAARSLSPAESASDTRGEYQRATSQAIGFKRTTPRSSTDTTVQPCGPVSSGRRACGVPGKWTTQFNSDGVFRCCCPPSAQ
jgi:hypothetical protein